MRYHRFVWSAAVTLLLAFAPCVLAQPDTPKELLILLKAKPAEPVATDDELLKLQKERYNAALDETQILGKQLLVGRYNLDQLASAVRRLVSSGLEIKTTSAEKIAWLELSLEFAKEVERQADARLKAGATAPDQYFQARYHRLDAEIMLVRAKRAAEKSK